MQHDTRPAIALPLDVRLLLVAPNYVHLSTLRADGRPRNHVVWVGLDGERVLICTSDWTWKAKDMRRDPRVALSVIDRDNPYRMAALQGRVVEERPDEDCLLMNPISIKYTGAPFPSRGPDRVCFVIAVEHAAQHTLKFVHRPGATRRSPAGVGHAARPGRADALHGLGRKPLVIPGMLNKVNYLAGKYLTPRRAQTALFGVLVSRALRERPRRS